MDKIKNEKGMTLVEVLIAVVITSIVLTTLFSFLNVITRQYTKNNREVSVQNEVQTLMMQLENFIIDAEIDVATVTYNAADDEPTGIRLYILNDESFNVIGFSSDDRCLYYYEYSDQADNHASDDYKNASTRNAKLAAAQVDDDGEVEKNTDLQRYLFAENISVFSPEIHISETENYVSLVLELNNEGEVYRSAKNIFLRNQIVQPTATPSPGASVTPTPTPTPVI